MEDFFDKYERRTEEKREQLRAAFAESPAIFVDRGRGRRELLIKSGETYPGGKAMRVSTFLADGPWGHHEYDNDAEAIRELSYEGFERVMPASEDEVIAWTTTPEFQLGAAAAGMVQAENELRWIASQQGIHKDLETAFERARQLAAPGTAEAYESATDVLQAELRQRRPRQNPGASRFDHFLRGLDFEPNPAWVTKSVARALNTINERVPPKWHPKLSRARQAHGSLVARLKEYGCGAYGCVLPTLDDRTVLKVTTDPTEAQFAAELAQTLIVPIVVDYRIVMQTSMRHQGRPVFLLWRESAEDVGKLEDHPLIGQQHQLAQVAYEEMYRTGTTAQGAIRQWRNSIRAMQTDPRLNYLASGMLRVYDEQGIFFGDVHGGNVGRCVRGERMEWVIIDPGHVSVVRKS